MKKFIFILLFIMIFSVQVRSEDYCHSRKGHQYTLKAVETFTELVKFLRELTNKEKDSLKLVYTTIWWDEEQETMKRTHVYLFKVYCPRRRKK